MECNLTVAVEVGPTVCPSHLFGTRYGRQRTHRQQNSQCGEQKAFHGRNLNSVEG
ncbi:MAG: hypothetical protein AAF892_05045 [Cyanobacteria bacterium P01_D01_bin.71]